jgi:hypothetical protein
MRCKEPNSQLYQREAKLFVKKRCIDGQNLILRSLKISKCLAGYRTEFRASSVRVNQSSPPRKKKADGVDTQQVVCVVVRCLYNDDNALALKFVSDVHY